MVALFVFHGGHVSLCCAGNEVGHTMFLHVLTGNSDRFFDDVSVSVVSVMFGFFLLGCNNAATMTTFSMVVCISDVIKVLLFKVSSSLRPTVDCYCNTILVSGIGTVFEQMVMNTVALSVTSLLFVFFTNRCITPLFMGPRSARLLAIDVINVGLFSLSCVAK